MSDHLRAQLVRENIELRDRAEAAESERDALREKVAKVEALLTEWEAGADEWGTCGHEWVSLHKLRAALSDPTTPDQPEENR